MKVKILDRVAQDAARESGRGGLVFATITIADRCPICGGPRGTPTLIDGYEDGEFYQVSAWHNPCGHVDDYADVIAEAIADKIIARQLALAEDASRHKSAGIPLLDDLSAVLRKYDASLFFGSPALLWIGGVEIGEVWNPEDGAASDLAFVDPATAIERYNHRLDPG